MRLPRSAVAALTAALLVPALGRCRDHATESAPTFNADVAPILFEHCAPCHHPGGAAPFPLLTYEDARAHDRLIALMTARRAMPPWMPEGGDFALAGERRLSEAEIARIDRWVRTGAPRGTGPPPTPPRIPEGWQLGEPDLVVTMAESYTLPADGLDAFRNFVVPIPIDRPRYVRAIELQPGNPRIVHHAIMGIDRTPATRRLDAADPAPGFGGMDMGGALPPDGHFLGWTPGKLPAEAAAGTAWRVSYGTDLVLQFHMLPTGKPETIRPVIGFHFTDTPPVREPSILQLFDRRIDIPAGEPRYMVEDRLVLPVAVEVHGIYPHAHYLGREIEVLAELPEGARKRLLHIPDWDFNWQDEYRYADPPLLPAGTVIHMRYSYDNSAANPRNPNVPPRRVVGGSHSTDEMASLLLQVIAASTTERLELELAQSRHMLEKNAGDVDAWINAGHRLMALGRLDEAGRHFERALELAPDREAAHYNLGVVAARQGRLDEARRRYERAIELNPDAAAAYNNLGKLELDGGHGEQALALLRRAVALRPDFGEAWYNLGLALDGAGRLEEALEPYRRALTIEPDHAMTHNNLGAALHALGRLDEAIASYARAIELDPQNAQARNNLGVALGARGRTEHAIGELARAVEIDPAFPLAHRNLGQLLLAAGRREEALVHLREALRLDAGDAEARASLETALRQAP